MGWRRETRKLSKKARRRSRPRSLLLERLEERVLLDGAPILPGNSEWTQRQGTPFSTTFTFEDADSSAWTVLVDTDGDGTTDTLSVAGAPQFSVSRPCTELGSYYIDATITDAQGHSVTGTLGVLNVYSLVAQPGGPYSIAQGTSSLTLTGGATTSNIGEITQYAWDLDGDGYFGEECIWHEPYSYIEYYPMYGEGGYYIGEGEIPHYFPGYWEGGVRGDERGQTVAISTEGMSAGESWSVALEVTATVGAYGETSTDCRATTVAMTAPTAHAGGPYRIGEGRTLTLDGGGSVDPDNNIVLYQWSWQDRNGQLVTVAGTTASFVADFDPPRSVPVTLRVVDAAGAESVVTTLVSVTDVVPTARTNGPYSVLERGQVVLNAGQSSDPYVAIVSYEWDIGDDGVYELSGAASSVTLVREEWSSLLPFGQPVPLRLRVVNADGYQATTLTTISVINQSPVVVAGPAVSLELPQRLVRTVTFSDTSYGPWTARVAYGEKDANNQLIWTALPIEADGTIALDHAYAADGTYVVRVAVKDEHEREGSTSFPVTVANLPPSVSITGPLVLAEGETAYFSAMASDPGGDPIAYTWDLDGDHVYGEAGEVGQGATISYTPIVAASRFQTFRVRASDGEGGVGSANLVVHLQNTILPIAEAGGPYRVYQGGGVFLSAAGSLGAAYYLWDLDGDGAFGEQDEWVPGYEYTDPWGNTSWVEGYTIDHAGRGEEWGETVWFDATNAPAGVETVWLRAFDDEGHSSDPAEVYVIVNHPPGVYAGDDAWVNEGQVFEREGFVGDAESTSWSGWVDYGDGQSEYVGVDPMYMNFWLYHTYADSGTYEVCVTILDDGGQQSEDRFFVNVSNAPPGVTTTGDRHLYAGSLLQDTQLASYCDPDDGQISYVIEWGDGTTDTGSRVGSIGTVPGQHLYQQPGAYRVEIQVDDGDGGIGTIDFWTYVHYLEAQPGGPYQVNEGAALLLAGSGTTVFGAIDRYLWDLDGDGIFGEQGRRWTPPVIVPEQVIEDWIDGVYYRTVIPGYEVPGSWSGSGLRGDEYGPSPEFWAAGLTGPAIHTVSLKVVNEHGYDSATATVPISVLNVVPTADAGPDVTVPEGSSIILDGSASLDPGGQPVSYAWDLDGDGLYDDAFEAIATYSAALDVGPLLRSVGLKVTDATGAWATDTLLVTIQNLPPAVTVGGSRQLEGTLRFTAPGSFSDRGNGPWLVEVDYGDGGGWEATTHGEDHGFSLLHDYAAAGNYVVKVRVSDNHATPLCAQQQFLLEIGEFAPTADAGGPYTVDELQSVTLVGTATDPGDNVDWSTAAWDLDGDGLYETPGASVLFVANGVGQQNQAVVRFRVADSHGGWGSATATISINNTAAPTAVLWLPARVDPDGWASLSGLGSTDPGNNIVLYEWDLDGDGVFGEESSYWGVDEWGQSVWFSYGDHGDERGAVVGYHAAVTQGDYTVWLRVSDGLHSHTASGIVHVADNSAPTIVLGEPLAAEEGAAWSLGGSFADESSSWTAAVDYGDGGGWGPLSFSANNGFNLSHDYASAGIYTVFVQVTDAEGAYSQASVAATIVNAPPTDIALSNSIVVENSSAGTAVATISAADRTPSDTFTYTLVVGEGSEDNAAFTIDGSMLRTARTFDYERKSSYALRVRTTDSAGAWCEKALVVTVGDVNDPPTLDAIANQLVAEDCGEQVVVLTGVTPLGADPETVVVAAVTSDAALIGTPLLHYDAAQGIWSLHYTPIANATGIAVVTMTVTDAAAASCRRSFAITVTAANDAPRGIDGRIRLDEDATYTFRAADFGFADPNDQVPNNLAAVKILSLPAAGELTLRGVAVVPNQTVAASDIAAGELTFTPAANANGDDYAWLTFLVQDDGGTAEGGIDWAAMPNTLSFDVTPLNDPPTNVALSANTIAAGAHAGTLIGMLSAADAELQDVSYCLPAGFGDNALFVVQGNELRTAGVIGAFGQCYRIVVRCTDTGSQSRDQELTLYVGGNQAPSDLALSAATVPENLSAEAVVGHLGVVDGNPGDLIRFRLVEGDGGADNAAFRIDGDALVLLDAANYEAQPVYSVLVEAADAGGLTCRKALTITVTDVAESPLGLVLSTAAVAENNSPHAVVGTLSVIAEDAGEGFAFSLVAGPGGEDNASFTIDADSGALRINAAANYEAKSIYHVLARAENVGGLSCQQSLIVAVLDVNESPTAILLSASSLPADRPAGSFVGRLTAVDPDAGDAFVFTLVSGPGSEANSAFTIDPQGRLLSTRPLAEDEICPVRVRATDRAGLTSESSFVVAATAVVGELCLSNQSLDEQSTAVGFLSVASGWPEANYTYSFTGGQTPDDAGLFEIVGNELRALAPLDYEEYGPVITLAIDAWSNYGGTTHDFTITLVDVNEAPTALYLSDSTVQENQPVGTVVGQVVAVDEDRNDQYTYTMAAGAGDDDNAWFAVDSWGRLAANAVFHQAERSSYSVRLRVTDAAGHAIESSFVVSVLPASAPAAIHLGPAMSTMEGLIVSQAGSFVDADSTRWLASVDFGDGSGLQPLVLGPDGTFILTHVYAVAGQYTTTVFVRDDSGSVSRQTLGVTVYDASMGMRTDVPRFESPLANGSPSYGLLVEPAVLSTGYVVDPTTAFWPATLENRTAEQYFVHDQVRRWTDQYGVRYTAVESGSATLSIVATTDGLGSWTYNESWIDDLTVVTTASDGSGFSESIWRYYEFSAESTAVGGSSYVFHSSATAAAAGAYDRHWDDDSGGSDDTVTYQWQGAWARDRSIDTTDGVASGHTAASWGYSGSGVGLYGEAVRSRSWQSAQASDSADCTAGSGGLTLASAAAQRTYNGEARTPGDLGGFAYGYTDQFSTDAAGYCRQTARDGTLDGFWERRTNYVDVTPYAGGSITGTSVARGADGETFGFALSWSTASGTIQRTGGGNGDASGWNEAAYFAQGSYTIEDGDPQPPASGDGSLRRQLQCQDGENGYDYSAYRYTTGYELGPDGRWFATAGYGGGQGYGQSRNIHAGQGSYSYSLAGSSSGTITGTLGESSHHESAYRYSTAAHLAGGRWIETGLKWTEEGGGGGSHYSGEGSASGQSSASGLSSGSLGAANLTIRESGTEANQYAFHTAYRIGADGAWYAAAGEGEERGSSIADWSAEGSGAYSYATGGGTINGRFETGEEYHATDDYTITSRCAGGVWIASGERTTAQSGGADSSYSGSGDYAGSGTQSEQGADHYRYGYSIGYTLSSDGSWSNGSGEGSSSGSGESHYSYTNDDDYYALADDVTISGSTSLTGGEDASYAYSTHSTLQADQWLTTGSMQSTSEERTFSSYAGSGSATEDAVKTTREQSGNNTGSLHTAGGYTLTSTGTWQQTSGDESRTIGRAQSSATTSVSGEEGSDNYDKTYTLEYDSSDSTLTRSWDAASGIWVDGERHETIVDRGQIDHWFASSASGSGSSSVESGESHTSHDYTDVFAVGTDGRQQTSGVHTEASSGWGRADTDYSGSDGSGSYSGFSNSYSSYGRTESSNWDASANGFTLDSGSSFTESSGQAGSYSAGGDEDNGYRYGSNNSWYEKLEYDSSAAGIHASGNQSSRSGGFDYTWSTVACGESSGVTTDEVQQTNYCWQASSQQTYDDANSSWQGTASGRTDHYWGQTDATSIGTTAGDGSYTGDTHLRYDRTYTYSGVASDALTLTHASGGSSGSGFGHLVYGNGDEETTSFNFSTAITGRQGGHALETGSMLQTDIVVASSGSGESASGSTTIGDEWYSAAFDSAESGNCTATYRRYYRYSNGWSQASFDASLDGTTERSWSAAFDYTKGAGSGDGEEHWSGAASGLVHYSASCSGAASATATAVTDSSGHGAGSFSYSSRYTDDEGVEQTASFGDAYSYYKYWHNPGVNHAWGFASEGSYDESGGTQGFARSHNLPWWQPDQAPTSRSGPWDLDFGSTPELDGRRYWLPAENISMGTTDIAPANGSAQLEPEPQHLAGQSPPSQTTSVTPPPAAAEPSFTYDAQNRCTNITDAAGGVTSFTYNTAGNLASLTDPVGNTTSWLYDTAGNVVQETDPLGAVRAFSYDTAGNLARQVDRLGRVRQFAYDAAGHVISEAWYNSVADADAGLAAAGTLSYQYDGDGRLVAESDGHSAYTYTYDVAGRLASVTATASGAPTVVLVNAYDGATSRRSFVAATIDGVPDFLTTYQYDTQGRVVEIHQTAQPLGNAVADKRIVFRYGSGGRLAGIDRYQGSTLVVSGGYRYDAFGRLSFLDYAQGENPLASYAYGYGGPWGRIAAGWCGLEAVYAGMPTAEAVEWLPAPGVDTRGVVAALVDAACENASRLTAARLSGDSVAYGYDATGQLVGADYTTGVDEYYAYDANGNRTMAGYVVGAGNRLLSDGTYRYGYDPEGNRTARFIDVNADGLLNAGDTDITQYAWDHRNRLASVTTYALFAGPVLEVVCYTYDTQNRWIGQSIDTGGDGSIDRQVRFAYDGHQIVLQFAGDCPDCVQQNGTVPFTLDASGNPRLTAANLRHRYLWGSAVDQLLANEQLADPQEAGTILWPLTDNLGTVRDLAVTNPQTSVTTIANHRVYDAFGSLVSQTNAAVDCLFGFTGRAFDANTGLQNNLNRWYDVEAGAWTSQDPKGFAAGDANIGRYVGNRPTDVVDPAGLEHLPSDTRGTWIAGTRGNGTFQYADTLRNRQAGISGKQIRFTNNYIALGAFPAEAYYRGSAAAASVDISHVTGDDADAKAADVEMRRKLDKPDWKRPKGYTWHHAGPPGSTRLELVNQDVHGPVAHEGSASEARARAKSVGNGAFARCLAIGDAYLTLRDALQVAGLAEPDYIATEAPYYFVADDNSVFIVEVPGFLNWFSNPKLRFLAGPREGQTEEITTQDVTAYREAAEKVWGRYVPGRLFSDPRFLPGTNRQTLPIYENWLGLPRQVGWIDAEGVHHSIPFGPSL